VSGTPPASRPPMQSLPPTAAIVHPAGTNWVLVKGHHDSGTIKGVYGPYTEQQADWLLAEILDCSSYNWTKTRLRPDGA
jgi:hypothetical protein